MTTLRHGHARTGRMSPTYSSYISMLSRCYNAASDSYKWYGAKGVTVCQRWRDSFEAFLADLGERPPGTTLGRKENDRPYEPSNCEWQDSLAQARNRGNNRNLIYRGRKQCLTAWAAELGIRESTFRERLSRGWSLAKAIETPAPIPKGAK